VGGLDRAKRFVISHFERLLVVLLVMSIVGIHFAIDYKVAFLSFYYLPVIVAGFQIGRRGAVFAAVLIVVLVAFFQAVAGLEGDPGLKYLWLARADGGDPLMFTLVPWAGFLILTAYTVGSLADQRRVQLGEIKHAYMTMLELLTFHLESTERQTRGHSYRVAARVVAIGRQMGVPTEEVESWRVAALLHELKPDDARLSRLFEHYPGETRSLPVVASMRDALDIVAEYARYYELTGGDWSADHLRVRLGTKVLAVADSFETLQLSAATRAPMSVWGALEEIERGRGTMFATNVVRALRASVTPERAAVDAPALAAV
jgi:hypothetical protein